MAAITAVPNVKWKTSDSYLITYWIRFNNCTFLLLNANIPPLLLADDIHVFFSQLVRHSEVCSGRVNTHLEVDNGQCESVIYYDILVAMYCCYLLFTPYFWSVSSPSHTGYWWRFPWSNTQRVPRWWIEVPSLWRIACNNTICLTVDHSGSM